ncbi:P-loop NTPase fold protein [Spirosoma rhododendri]|uniref:KAP NTPase domain-containing protein n=1 Tax=Spirosoma rhododendri TaxID=2728024 RepID=A0A7L5DPS1_9BACT|nr:P-loop NTPase fold protein [Spirosoma rhododendri]QJD79582.1 hypothetical protein HH216_15025 [Spirosoma rhododendri]
MKVSVTDPSKAFQHHIDNPENQHILFSGAFGFGKSYFLNDFFSRNEDSYSAFFISPVKYAVGYNEDIFDYIKIDVASALIASGKLPINVPKHFSESEYLSFFIRENASEILNILYESLKDDKAEKIKKIIDSVSKVLDFKEKYNKWKDTIRKADKNLIDSLSDVSKQYLVRKGSIYEDDILTQLIRGSVEKIRNETSTKTVLVIDDFDRLDPEHIFRILNIFSVHNNYYDQENKFGFDRIIIVCSLLNIQRIYEYKYGTEVDFNGYIEKFYSTDVFYFHNQKAISEFCSSEFSADLDEYSQYLLSYVLSYFVEKDIISIRSIIKHSRTFFFTPFTQKFVLNENFSEVKNEQTTLVPPVDHRYGYTEHWHEKVWSEDFIAPYRAEISTFSVSSDDLPILKILKILVTIFGDYNNLLEVVSRNREDKSLIHFDKTIILIKSLAISWYVFQNFSIPENIIIEKRPFPYSRNGNRTYQRFGKPVINFNGMFETKIPLKWDQTNQYDGEASLFQGIDYDNWEIVYPIRDPQSFTTGTLMDMMRDTLLQIERCGQLPLLGITKNRKL